VARFTHQSVHDEIRARSDQRAHAAQDRGIADRQQHTARRDAPFVGPLEHHRHAHRDDRRVVHEGRGRPEKGERAPQSCGCGGRVAEKSHGDLAENSGAQKTRRDDEERSDGEHAVIGEPGDRLARRHHPDEQQKSQRAQEDDVGKVRIAHQTDNQEQEDPDCDPALPFHRELPARHTKCEEYRRKNDSASARGAHPSAEREAERAAGSSCLGRSVGEMLAVRRSANDWKKCAN